MLRCQPWFTPAGVEHWHGAAPDQEAPVDMIEFPDIKAKATVTHL